MKNKNKIYKLLKIRKIHNVKSQFRHQRIKKNHKLRIIQKKVYLCEYWINKERMEYTAIIEKANDGWYVAQCAEVPNAHTQGHTIEEVKENLKEAIELVLSCEREIAMRNAAKSNVFFRKIAVL